MKRQKGRMVKMDRSKTPLYFVTALIDAVEGVLYDYGYAYPEKSPAKTAYDMATEFVYDMRVIRNEIKENMLC